MPINISLNTLVISVCDSIFIFDALLFEVYTQIVVTPEQEVEIAGDKMGKIKIPSLNYHYIDSDESRKRLNEAFDIIFSATAKSLWQSTDSVIDNIKQLEVK